MKTITNISLIRKIKNIMRGIMLGSFVCFGIAIFLMFSYSVENTPLAVLMSIILLIVAFTLFRIYVLLTGRYGASPRLDERLSMALKGLSSEFTLYNYVFENPNVLVGKANVWLLELYEVSGSISYDRKLDKWKFKKGGNAFTRFLSSDSFRAPQKDLNFMEKDWKASITRIENQNDQNFSQLANPEKILVFMHSDVEIHAEDSALILLRVDKLKEHIRKNVAASSDQGKVVKRLTSLLPDFLDA